MFRPSVVAASAVVIALLAAFPDQFDEFETSILSCQYVNERELRACIREMVQMQKKKEAGGIGGGRGGGGGGPPRSDPIDIPGGRRRRERIDIPGGSPSAPAAGSSSSGSPSDELLQFSISPDRGEDAPEGRPGKEPQVEERGRRPGKEPLVEEEEEEIKIEMTEEKNAAAAAWMMTDLQLNWTTTDAHE